MIEVRGLRKEYGDLVAVDDVSFEAAAGEVFGLLGPNIWFYVNRMGVFYWQMLERNGYEAEVAASRKAFAAKDKAASFAAISERMIRDLQCIGPIEEVREQLRERSAAGADLQLVYMPDGDRATVAKWLEALVS